MRKLFAQLARFGAVGLVGLVVDITAFNILRQTLLSPDAIHHGPIAAKIVSTTLAIAVNWVGNRYWTFGAQRRSGERRANVWREGAQFAAVSVGGLLIAIGCLWVSHYALGLTSALADNISANVIGLALGTVFRFALYRYWVFRVAGELRATESPVVPAGTAPRHGVKAVTAVDDRLLAHE